MYLIVLSLILGLVLTGCSLLSNIGQAPANDQSEVSNLIKGNFNGKCPAAPAVAGLLLEAAGIDNRYGTGKDKGNYIADVAHEMGPQTNFHDVDKCDIENYRIEIAKFLIDKGADVGALFEAELESVVYGGTCNNSFGTYLDETMTLTFSNNVAIQYGDQVLAETYVYFDTATPLGHNLSYMLYTAEGNQVTITVTGTFGNPRPAVGDFVNGLNGIVDALGYDAKVPDGGVIVEGLTFNGNVEGWVGADLNTGIVTGFTTGDFSTEINGNIDPSTYVEGQYAGFMGTISGDINGNVTGGVNWNGFDTLSAVITNSGACGYVYLIGIFSGDVGEFEAQFVTLDSPIDFVTSIAITGGDSVLLGDTLQMSATTSPSGAPIAWTVWTDGITYTGTATIDQETGLLTADAVGPVVVIASALDGSLFTQNHVVTIF